MANGAMSNGGGSGNGHAFSGLALRQWLVPGILMAIMTSILSVVGSYAVNNYRLSKLEDTVMGFDARIDKIWNRIDAMSQSGIDLARTQEQMRALSNQISEMKAENREQNGRNDARYDNLSTRLARQGF